MPKMKIRNFFYACCLTLNAGLTNGVLRQFGLRSLRRILATSIRFLARKMASNMARFVGFDYPAGLTRLNVAASSTLHWAASPDGRAAGYEVPYRDTISPLWEKVWPAGAQSQITVPYSKDHVVFAVRAYEADGHRRLPVHPTPER